MKEEDCTAFTLTIIKFQSHADGNHTYEIILQLCRFIFAVKKKGKKEKHAHTDTQTNESTFGDPESLPTIRVWPNPNIQSQSVHLVLVPRRFEGRAALKSRAYTAATTQSHLTPVQGL